MLNPEKLRPINGQIVVKDDPKEEKIGKIYLADNAKGDAHLIRGTILAESPFLLENGEYQDTKLRAGMRVVYSQHAGAGNTYDQDNVIYRIMRWNEVLAVEVK